MPARHLRFLVRLPSKIEQLAVKIYQSSWEFNQIVCLARWTGVGDLARIYNQPLAILATSYVGSGKQERDVNVFPPLDDDHYRVSSRILLVDDLVDSGITLHHTPG